MRIFERLVRLALRAYPTTVRDERGPEMLSTPRDAADARDLRPARELGALVINGLRARGALAVQRGPRAIWREAATSTAICISGVLVFEQLMQVADYVHFHWLGDITW